MSGGDASDDGPHVFKNHSSRGGRLGGSLGMGAKTCSRGFGSVGPEGQVSMAASVQGNNPGPGPPPLG